MTATAKLLERQRVVGRNADGTPLLHLANFRDVCAVLGVKVDRDEIIGLRGYGWHEQRDEHGQLKSIGTFKNLITDQGDLYYAGRAVLPSGLPKQVTGMRIGTGTAAAAKSTNTGTPVYARIQTYTTGQNCTIAINTGGGYPTATDSAGAGATAAWQAAWAAGQSTLNGLSEVTLTEDDSNSGSFTDSGASPYNVDGNTISRALLSPTVNKAALDTLTVSWNHVLLGA